jgi:predicted  nucleic acid-binding Zn-ribbon protein
MSNCNPTLAAIRTELREIRQQAEALDADIAAVQSSELRGERVLTTLTVAEVLVRLHGIGQTLATEADDLRDAIGDLDQDGHVHDGVGGAD